MFGLTKAHQHYLANESQHAMTLFVPEKDRYSKNAFQADLIDFFEYPGGSSQRGIPILNQIFAILLLPIFLMGWFYWRKFYKKGWLIHFEEKTFTAIKQKNNEVVRVDAEFGVLVYEQKIELTHRTKGPILVLYQAAPIGDDFDLKALNLFADTLALRLGIRVVGQRATFMSLRARLISLSFMFAVGLIVFIGFFGAVKISW